MCVRHLMPLHSLSSWQCLLQCNSNSLQLGAADADHWSTRTGHSVAAQQAWAPCRLLKLRPNMLSMTALWHLWALPALLSCRCHCTAGLGIGFVRTSKSAERQLKVPHVLRASALLGCCQQRSNRCMPAAGLGSRHLGNMGDVGKLRGR
jgi:hypothetical protein